MEPGRGRHRVQQAQLFGDSRSALAEREVVTPARHRPREPAPEDRQVSGPDAPAPDR